MQGATRRKKISNTGSVSGSGGETISQLRSEEGSEGNRLGGDKNDVDQAKKKPSVGRREKNCKKKKAEKRVKGSLSRGNQPPNW